MNVLMIHEVEDWMLDLDLSEYDMFTFDDGYKSQYNNYKHFQKFNKPMKFFVPTLLLGAKNYMTWDQANELHSTANCSIGGHSHSHPDLRNIPIDMQYFLVQNECTNMMHEFGKRNITVNSFCYPYNHEALGYKHILSNFGIKYYYGSERKDIEDLKCTTK